MVGDISITFRLATIKNDVAKEALQKNLGEVADLL
jgi:hypothetical protein